MAILMMATGILFPNIEPSTIRGITAPVLLLSGAKSYPFLELITEELAGLLPNRETIVLPDAEHQMWHQAPDVCRKGVEKFLKRISIPSMVPADHDLRDPRDEARLLFGTKTPPVAAEQVGGGH